MLSHCIEILAVLLSATRARVVVLILQPLVAEEAHLIPAAREVAMEAVLAPYAIRECANSDTR